MKRYYGEFSEDDLTEHVDDLLMRFQNKALGDTIFRVGCDLRRKLGSDDRLVGAIKAAIVLDLPYDKILFTLICACRFMARDENGNLFEDDIRIIKQFEKGPASSLNEICGFSKTKYSGLIIEFKIINKELNRNEARGMLFSEFLCKLSLKD